VAPGYNSDKNSNPANKIANLTFKLTIHFILRISEDFRILLSIAKVIEIEIFFTDSEL
jgi:hypothetical protein